MRTPVGSTIARPARRMTGLPSLHLERERPRKHIDRDGPTVGVKDRAITRLKRRHQHADLLRRVPWQACDDLVQDFHRTNGARRGGTCGLSETPRSRGHDQTESGERRAPCVFYHSTRLRGVHECEES